MLIYALVRLGAQVGPSQAGLFIGMLVTGSAKRIGKAIALGEQHAGN